MNTYTVHYGGKGGTTYALVESEGLLAMRTHSRNLVEMQSNQGAALSNEALSILQHFELLEEYHDAGVMVWRAQGDEERDAAALN